MEHNVEAQKLGTVWLCIAGPVAIALTFALYTVNNRLTDSKGEQILGDKLRELRGAQAGLASHPSEDARQMSYRPEEPSLKAVTNAELHDGEEHEEASH